MPNYYKWTLSLKDGTQLDSGLEWAENADEIRNLVIAIANERFSDTLGHRRISVIKLAEQEKPIEEMDLGELFNEAGERFARIDAVNRRVDRIRGGLR